jgi:hypothetical protein
MRLAMARQLLLPLLLLLLPLPKNLSDLSELSHRIPHLFSEMQWLHAIDLTISRSAHL